MVALKKKYLKVARFFSSDSARLEPSGNSNKKKTRTGGECNGKMRKSDTAVAKQRATLEGKTDAQAYTLYWTRIDRELNTFCSCPLPVHSKEFHGESIPQRLYKILHRIGTTASGYRPGTTWCTSFRKYVDDLFKSEQEYIPP